MNNFDLETRTLLFARNVRRLIKVLPRTIGNLEDSKQLVRSSGSVGANYIEANEGLGRKDFVMHIKIARKEAKESHYWLQLIETDAGTPSSDLRANLLKESKELLYILSAIINKMIRVKNL